ncbi:MAG: hypothetical protein JXA54_12145 [Candidatus Heimdallarchaeota archaeon]|nr:hypothetical protein [Candidatus Heimdallarchaeota archaeon]
MADYELAFFITIGVLGLVIVLFIGFFFYVKSMMPTKLLGTIMTTLHAALFGYETALIELIGPRGYRTHVFPQIVETMRDMKEQSPLLVSLFQSKEIGEALNQWMKILGEAKVVKNGTVIEKEDGSFEIVIPHCMLCDPIHKMIGDQKGICPMALILASAGHIADNTKEPVIEYSTFTPTGTVTSVKFD